MCGSNGLRGFLELLREDKVKAKNKLNFCMEDTGEVSKSEL